MSPTLELAIELIRCPSITPNDAGCQTIIASRLQTLGFSITPLRFGHVDNLWARRGTSAPLFVFAGHTDVVPTGPIEDWQFPPFTPTVDKGMLYGRGAADMKGGLAAMVVACEQFLAAHSQHRGSIAFLLTSDEEGPSVDGTAKVIKYLQKRDEQIDLCLLAEPSSMERVGDSVKNGRRGSLTGHLLVNGIQGHVAYPQKADNPIHRSIPFLQALNSVKWDQGNEFFPPTSFQITNIHAGTGADNVIPSKLELLFNFRYSTEVTHTQLQQQVKTLLEQHGVKYHLTWHHSGVPFLTMPGNLVKATQQAIKEICGYETQLSTAGGTSDGRFIAPTGAQLVELGPINATIHQINECVNIADLDILTIIYQRILEKLLLEKT